MAGEDLFDERGSRARHAHDEEGSPARRLPWLGLPEKSRGKRLDDGVDCPRKGVAVELSPDPQHRVAAAEMLGSGIVLPASVVIPGHGQMEPEQLEIARLKREVIKLKAERDILKKAAAYFAKEST
jgi:transposase-like protein